MSIVKTLPTGVSTVSVDGFEVPYRSLGEGKLLLCSELPLNPFARYALLQEKLASRYRVIVFDLRPVIGRSPSAPPAEDLLGFLSEFSLRFADALGLDSFCLAGSFMYGGVAMNVARLAPHRVSGLVLIGPLGIVPGPQSLLMRGIVAFYKLPGIPFLHRFRICRALVEDLDHGILGPIRLRQIYFDPQVASVTVEELYEQNQTPEYPPAILALMWAIRKMRYDALVPKLSEIGCPALILHGEQDVWIPISYAEDLQRRLTRSTLKVIPKSRHVPEIEQLELTTQAVEEFLNAVPDVARSSFLNGERNNAVSG